jgi:hypothetical protein
VCGDKRVCGGKEEKQRDGHEESSPKIDYGCGAVVGFE